MGNRWGNSGNWQTEHRVIIKGKHTLSFFGIFTISQCMQINALYGFKYERRSVSMGPKHWCWFLPNTSRKKKFFFFSFSFFLRWFERSCKLKIFGKKNIWYCCQSNVKFWALSYSALDNNCSHFPSWKIFLHKTTSTPMSQLMLS